MIGIRDLSVRYPGGVAALKRTTLSIRRGEFTVLLGPSGAGKSTLLRALNGLVRPTTGTIRVDGLGSIEDKAVLHRHRQRTGMIFQQHQLIGRLTALANVLIGRLGHHSTFRSFLPLPQADRRLALECLDRVGLLDRALERVDRLSGGQQQRVGIARATAQQPEIVLADEPVASLDPATATQVLGQLHTICKADGLTAIVSLHQVPLAQQFADRVIGLVAGEVAFDGSPAELTEFDLDRIYSLILPAARALNSATVSAAPASLATEEV